MSQYSPLFAIAALVILCIPDQQPISRISLGTHTPASALNVWRLALKNGAFGSAFPVVMKDDKHALFLTAAHMMTGFVPGAGIIEDRTKLRKLVIVSHVVHEKVDLAVLTVLVDKKLALIPLGLDVKRDLGMCVFNVGFTNPNKHWIAHRGWLMQDAYDHGMSSAFVKHGMSGGAVLTPNDGKAIGVIVGSAWARLNRLESVYTKEGEQVGAFYPLENSYEQSFYVPLAPHKKWLKLHGVE